MLAIFWILIYFVTCIVIRVQHTLQCTLICPLTVCHLKITYFNLNSSKYVWKNLAYI